MVIKTRDIDAIGKDKLRYGMIGKCQHSTVVLRHESGYTSQFGFISYALFPIHRSVCVYLHMSGHVPVESPGHLFATKMPMQVSCPTFPPAT